MLRIFCIFVLLLGSGLLWSQPAALHTIRLGDQDLHAFLRYEAGATRPLISAHRGGRNIPGYPENAIPTFEYVLSHTPAIIECDVNMSRDSVLFLMHDYSLDRTTTGSGKLSRMDWAEIKTHSLLDDFGDTTDYRIPTLREVLEWAKGKTVLTLDVKRGAPYERVIREVEATDTENCAAIITYSVEAAQKVNRLNPELMISVSIRNAEELERVEKAGIPYNRIIAFTGTREPDPALYRALHERGILCILGTLGNLDRMAQARGEETYRDFVRRGADVLATDNPLEAAKALQPLAPARSVQSNFMN